MDQTETGEAWHSKTALKSQTLGLHMMYTDGAEWNPSYDLYDDAQGIQEINVGMHT